MKLILTLCITWALLLTGESLQCLTCTDATCTNPPVTCPSNSSVCQSSTIQSSIVKDPSVSKSCVEASNCMTPLNVTTTQLSVNLGFANFRQTQLCCDQDSCNNQTLPVPSSNGRKCSSCISVLDKVCNTPVDCVGVEDNCIHVNVTGAINTVLKGCASSSLCNVSVITSFLPPVLSSVLSSDVISALGFNVSCNTAPSTGPVNSTAPSTGQGTNTAPSTGPVSVVLMAMWLPMMVKLTF
ncbi:extracellular matrix protein A-like [Hypomesus transpacificus]|uniref:extracellular matrix protein A-like n=1 Tax=Hypomesus transpacificus TaxID=137520 RepID=UPI001F073E1E|nr:extracellular matrix protein A-like [Hypomesus transpacificus]